MGKATRTFPRGESASLGEIAATVQIAAPMWLPMPVGKSQPWWYASPTTVAGPKRRGYASVIQSPQQPTLPLSHEPPCLLLRLAADLRAVIQLHGF